MEEKQCDQHRVLINDEPVDGMVLSEVRNDLSLCCIRNFVDGVSDARLEEMIAFMKQDVIGCHTNQPFPSFEIFIVAEINPVKLLRK